MLAALQYMWESLYIAALWLVVWFDAGLHWLQFSAEIEFLYAMVLLGEPSER